MMVARRAQQRGDPMSLFHFHNEFDNVDVDLADAQGRTDHDAKGPFIVTLTCHSPEVATENTREEFQSFFAAMQRFTNLIQNEMEAFRGEASI
jgi:hypothetical protein